MSLGGTTVTRMRHADSSQKGRSWSGRLESVGLNSWPSCCAAGAPVHPVARLVFCNMWLIQHYALQQPCGTPSHWMHSEQWGQRRDNAVTGKSNNIWTFWKTVVQMSLFTSWSRGKSFMNHMGFFSLQYCECATDRAELRYHIQVMHLWFK